MQTRVMLSSGINRDDRLPPRPAALFVTVELGHQFRAVPPEEQRDMIERGLTDALSLAWRKLDEVNAPAEVGA